MEGQDQVILCDVIHRLQCQLLSAGIDLLQDRADLLSDITLELNLLLIETSQLAHIFVSS